MHRDLETEVALLDTYLDWIDDQPPTMTSNRFYIELQKMIAYDSAEAGLERYNFYVSGNISQLALWEQEHLGQDGAALATVSPDCSHDCPVTAVVCRS